MGQAGKHRYLADLSGPHNELGHPPVAGVFLQSSWRRTALGRAYLKEDKGMALLRLPEDIRLT